MSVARPLRVYVPIDAFTILKALQLMGCAGRVRINTAERMLVFE